MIDMMVWLNLSPDSINKTFFLKFMEIFLSVGLGKMVEWQEAS